MTNSPSSEASHDSGDEHNDASHNSKAPAVKDKECQYCHQKFTSSSLGRHLDQFISKKKPDGIHDVDEIRRMRGGITRRTARNKKEQDEVNSNQHSPSPQYTLPSYSELLNKTTNAPNEFRFNRMNWQATGVITDPTNLNPPTVNVASPSISNTPANIASGTKRNFSTYASDLPALNPVASETTRALELSLREVLDAVRTATKKASPPSQPFSFDFTAQTFPYLCLALLPVPATLFSSTPFTTSASIPLNSPGMDQYQALCKTVENNIEEWKWARVAHIQRTSTGNFSEDMDIVTDNASAHLQGALHHLEAAYQNFMSFPLEARQNLWTIELLRSYKTEQNKVKEANSRIERLLQETNQLQQQVDHLSKCQWPREMALWPPDRVTLDERTRDELNRVNLIKREINGIGDVFGDGHTDEQQRSSSMDRWDYDLLLSKWKKHVREDRSRRSGVPPSFQLLSGAGPPPPPLENHISAPSEHSTASTPRIPSGLAKSTIADYRSGGSGHNPDGVSIHDSPVVNGTTVGSLAGPPSLDTRRRNIHVLSDVEDIFTPRLKGLRADNVMKSASP